MNAADIYRHSERLPKSSTVIILLAFLFATITLLTVYFSAQRNATQSLEETANYHMTRFSNALQASLSKHAYLPTVLAQNTEIKAFLTTHNHQKMQQAETLNRYLERINALANTSDVYVMLPSGRTVLSSNWHTNHSFIGKQFAFRPYFQQARDGKLGRYFAVGTTSGARGYYFASPIRDHESSLIGVLAVKVSIDDFEANWQDDSFDYLVTDPDGIVFMSNRKGRKLTALKPLNDAQHQTQQAIRRYPPQDFALTPINWSTYMHIQRTMPTEGWNIHILLDKTDIQRTANFTLMISGIMMALTLLLFFTLWKNHWQRRQFEQQARTELERKVTARTKELQRTQEELVQAAKMAALGQLAAGINHELNNPLSAIRAYSDNALQFLERDRFDMAHANLEKISALTERMGSITRQLKTFSRKSAGTLTSCHLPQALDSALLIAKQCITQSNATIVKQLSSDAHTVKADLIWLEQILVNLISNAAEAVADQATRTITIRSEHKGQHVHLHIHDCGTGIQEMDMPHIFEEFFTTKSIGKGLGLGLAISYRLAKDMQGELSAANAPEGGAIFTLTLPYLHTSNAA